MEEIYRHMKQMGILLMLGNLLQYILPSQEYARYVKLLTITVLMAYFAAPLFRFFSPAGFEQFCENCEFYYKQIWSESDGVGNVKDFGENLEEAVEEKWLEWGSVYMENGIKEEVLHEGDK